MDMNIMVDLPTLERQPGYAGFKEAYEGQTRQCPTIELSESIRSDMQARVGSTATCSNGRPGRDKCPAGNVCASPTGDGPKPSHGARGWASLTALATGLLATYTIAA